MVLVLYARAPCKWAVCYLILKPVLFLLCYIQIFTQDCYTWGWGGPENGDTSLCTFMHTHGGKHTFLLCVDRQQNRWNAVGNATSKNAGEPESCCSHRTDTCAISSFCFWKVKVLFAQLCLTLCNPMDCSHGIPQARVLEWVAIHSLLQGLFPTQGSNAVLPHFRQILYLLSHQENLFLEPPLRCEGAQAAITQHHQPSAL